MNLVILGVFFLVTVLLGQLVTWSISKVLMERITSANKSAEGAEGDKVKALSRLEIFSKQTQSFKWMIGALEAALFFFAAIYINATLREHVLNRIAGLVLGWMAIKMVGNFQSWSEAPYGRGLFYRFLIGSFINIGISILFALIFFWATNQTIYL